jgi:hypothetical protein
MRFVLCLKGEFYEFLYFYLVKRVQSILILADEDLIWYRICCSLLESFFVVVDDSTMHILDCALDLQTHSKYHVVSSVQHVNAVFSIEPSYAPINMSSGASRNYRLIISKAG